MLYTLIGFLSYYTSGQFLYLYTLIIIYILLVISLALSIKFYLKLRIIFGIIGCILIGFLLLFQVVGHLKIENGYHTIENINFYNSLIFFSQLSALIGFGIINLIFFTLIQSNDENDEKIIRKTALDFGTKYSRIEIREISKKCNKDPRFIIQIIKKMIEDQEIYAEYFSSTKSVVFDKNANIEAINILMKKYEEWETEKKEKPKN